ncbi:N-acetylmuramidase family protein [Microvirga solisilvae]|uniref:N-acetylmuramidase family protein n=1 Tax=Microvirga solisilvae TaxID=2919498 RepID=UPI001FAE7B33|nr:N-acetylmuramidase family protein [Microvirga solisilvae]
MTTENTGDAFARAVASGFRGAAKRLDDIDLPRIGHRIGVGEDEIHAFMDVETRGSGFDEQGRPKILFEPHVFYRNLSGTKLDTAIRQGLACKSWGQIPYGKESAQYGKLEKALRIDETAALKACSWGLAQILGENHLDAGYDTPQSMVLAFMADEETHLDAMVSFLIANRLDDDLREHRWEALARGYNGPGYAKNGYHLKLPIAFEKWRKIRDTPWSPEAPPPVQVPQIPAAVTISTSALVGAILALAAVFGIDPTTLKQMIP